MNNVVLSGRLTNQPESRQVGDATVTKFGLAVKRRFVGKDGTKVDFFDCEAWRKSGEIVEKWVGKGDSLVVQGELRNEEWKDKDSGAKRTKTMVVVENVSLVSSKGAEAKLQENNLDNTGTDDSSIPF